MKLPFLLFAGISLAAAATVNFPDSSCDSSRQDIIKDEMNHAQEMAKSTAADLKNGVYYDTFFALPLRNKPDFEGKVKNVYERIEKMAEGTLSDFSYSVTCDQTTIGCSKKHWAAHMGDGSTKVMNFCDKFFNEPRIRATNSLKADCNMDLRAAQFGRAPIIIHEFTHTSYAMNALGGKKTSDYAYGFNNNYQLPLSIFDRSCAAYVTQESEVLCPDKQGKESVCSGYVSAENADTYAFVAAGVFFSQICKKPIPLPPRPASVPSTPEGPTAEPTSFVTITFQPPTSQSSISQETSVTASTLNSSTSTVNPTATVATITSVPSTSCPINDDYIIIDGDEEAGIGIGGYVAFGDSFAAGMGTGTTSGDGCRVGSNNFGKLLHDWLGGDAVLPFERKVCSGDTTTGLNRQIDEWSDTEKVNLGTVSIGGNDLNFSDLVQDCLLTPRTYRWRSTNRANCEKGEKAARDHMNDLSENGLRYKLQHAYVRILEKSGRDDFHLYVTSYPSFFNYDTTDCDKTTFHYWWAGYNPASDWPFYRIVFLTQDLRREIDDLVDDLNTLIRKAVDDANKAHGGQQVHFVDTNIPFSGHRWCENDKAQWHEPDENVESTYFFLSAWKDLSIDGQVVNMNATEEAELEVLGDAGKIELPDANTCRGELGTDPDPYAVALCRAAESIAEDPDGEFAVALNQANDDLANGDYHTEHVQAWAPSRQIKTFHPRSPGMMLYRDAIIKKIQEIGQI